MSPHKPTKKQKEILLADIWSDAIFNVQSLDVIERMGNRGLSDAASQKSLDILATSRNRNLIPQEEQKKLTKTVVAFFGLSVGSHAAVTWMLQSRAETVKIMDPDVITPTNLNRLRVPWKTIGAYKADLVKQEVQSICPHADVIAVIGKTTSEMRHLIFDAPSVDYIVDEIDDLEGKVALRKFARERSIPLLSATDVGDNVVVDIERYDIDPRTQPFLGRVPDIEHVNFETLPFDERVRLVLKIVGFDACSEAMLSSLFEIGKTLPTWPQLGAAATMAGGMITTVLKKIVLGEQIESGRYICSLDVLFDKRFEEAERKKRRKQLIDALQKKWNV